MTPAERWARVSPRRRAMIAQAMMKRLDGVAGSDVAVAAEYLEAEIDLQIAVRERLRAHDANRRAEAHKGRAAILAADVARLEAIVSRALDHAHDEHEPGVEPDQCTPLGALIVALNEADLYDVEDGRITPAGEALALRVARHGSAPDPAAPEPPPFSQTTAEYWEEATRARLGYYPGHEPDCAERQTPFGLARCGCGPKEQDGPLPTLKVLHPSPHPAKAAQPRPLRVYVAGGSSEAVMVRGYIARLRAAGVEITHDWTLDVMRWRAAGSPPLTAEERAAHARANLEGIERADVVWWILPAAKSEGASFEAGVAYGLVLARIKAEPPDTPFCDPGCECASCLAPPHHEPRLVVSGDRAAHGRVFPEIAAQRWDSHDAALAAIVSIAAAHRDGDQIPTS